jgi:hypothetical protein
MDQGPGRGLTYSKMAMIGRRGTDTKVKVRELEASDESQSEREQRSSKRTLFCSRLDQTEGNPKSDTATRATIGTTFARFGGVRRRRGT